MNTHRLFSLLLLLFIAVACTSPAESGGEAEAVSPPTEGAIAVDSTTLRYVVEGEGRPCLVIGSSVYYPRTFSDELRKHFRFYFVDMRWFAADYQPLELTTFDLDRIAADIEKVRTDLGLEDVVLVGHSIHGTVALEYAKRYPEHISHLVLIGSPNKFGNAEFDAAVDALWETASEERKAYYQEIWEAMRDSLQRLPGDEAMIASYLTNGARYWYELKYDAGWLWEDMHVNSDLTTHLFGTLFAGYDMRDSGHRLDMPVWVALGKYDYAIPYTLWDKEYEMIPDLEVTVFEQSGHTPQLEDSVAFDTAFVSWVNQP